MKVFKATDMELFSFKIKDIESILTKIDKQTIGKIWINYRSSQIIQVIIWNSLFLDRCFCIFPILHCKDYPYFWVLKQTFYLRFGQVFMFLKTALNSLLQIFSKYGFLRPEGFQLYSKETPTQVFFCKYCGIFKNSFFIEHFH